MSEIRQISRSPQTDRRRDLYRRLRRFVLAAERGEDSSFEFTTLIMPLILMILLVAFATIVRATQMPIWTAASECAHEAIVSLTENIGRAQATQAALDSLHSNAIDATSVVINITGTWEPNTPITCQVQYNIDVHNLAFISEVTGGYIPMSAQVTLRTEPYKSKWQ